MHSWHRTRCSCPGRDGHYTADVTSDQPGCRPSEVKPRLGIVVGPGAVTTLEIYSALRAAYQLVLIECDGMRDPAARALRGRVEVATLQTREQHPDLADLRLDGVTTFASDGVRDAAIMAAELGRGLSALDRGRALYNKAAQRTALGTDLGPPFVALGSRAGAPVHDILHELREAVRRVGLPAVIKPVEGSSSRGVSVVRTMSDLSLTATTIASSNESGWLVEAMLNGQDNHPRASYVSVESVVVGSTIHHLSVTYKLPLVAPFRELGQYLIPAAQTDPAETARVVAATTAALQRIEVRDGVTHTELKLTPRGPRIIEVNGRAGGLIPDLLRAGGGPDLIRIAAALATSQDPGDLAIPDLSEVVFQYAPLGATTPGVLQAVRGLAAVLKIPGVDAYRPHVRPGTAIDGSSSTVTMGVLSGSCPHEEALADIVSSIESTLAYQLSHDADRADTLHDSRGEQVWRHA